tara:strand:+ start:867 stop:2657 length:1791 start_codon:yes stop_codon:yes gene_type:complete
MANVRGGIGSLSWGIVPVNWDSSNLATMSWDYRNNFLKSANDQLRYQVQWNAPGINEGSPLTQEGELINVIFKVETSVDGTHWNTIGKIKKSRDIANKRFETGTQPNGHRFTIDISQLVSDQLSYSLCPINKGTWQSNYYGGMNGGLTMQDNVIGSQMSAGNPISNYNVSENGTFRRVRVSATFEILDADSQVITASDTLSYPPYLTVINSVNQYERDDVYYNKYNVDYRTGYEFLTRCPNLSYGSVVQDFKKPVRIDEQAEWLQFYMRIGWSFEISGSGATLNDKVCAMGIKISTYIGDSLENTFYLNDFQQNIIESTFGGFSVVDNYQNQMFIQNISPYYINNTAALKTPNSPPSIGRSTTGIADNWSDYTGDKITANTTRYTANLVKVSLYSPYVVLEVSHSYNYTIDRESANIPYGYVRFHWLNSLGAIDSYTAKRDVVEGLTISRDVIERKSGDRTWYQANSGAVNGSEQNVNPNSSYISDTMRGGDIYKGGREVSSINADRVESVYTEPLNKSVAKWLEEMILSPNVWIEKDTDATARGNSSNPYLRPSTKGYIPVIITNSDAETVNQSEGLVKFNIEYTLAHKVQTQRN